MQKSHDLLSMMETNLIGVVLPYDSFCYQLGDMYSIKHGTVVSSVSHATPYFTARRILPWALGGCV